MATSTVPQQLQLEISLLALELHRDAWVSSSHSYNPLYFQQLSREEAELKAGIETRKIFDDHTPFDANVRDLILSFVDN